jgi:1,4-dihydroxy-2-naphthoate octaprenyltransferase
MIRSSITINRLLLLVLSMVLGSAVAGFAGEPIDWSVFTNGTLLLIFLHIAMGLVGQFFYMESDLLERLRSLLKLNQARRPGEELIIERPRYLSLLLSLPFFTLFVFLFIFLMQTRALTPGALLFLLIIIVLAILENTPPARLARSPYRDLAAGFNNIALPAVLALLLQGGEAVGLLMVYAIPLLLLFLALRITQALEKYEEDLRMERSTLLNAIGWERGMLLHNLFVLVAFLLLLLAGIFTRFSWRLLAPCLIALPFGLLQVWQMISIANGAPVRWRLLRFSAHTTLYLCFYLALFTLLVVW